jgi:protein dpy-30
MHVLSWLTLLLLPLLGMSELVKERPANPVEWLASYLLQHDPQRAGATGPAPPSGSMPPSMHDTMPR